MALHLHLPSRLLVGDILPDLQVENQLQNRHLAPLVQGQPRTPKVPL
jgi:hypothetical protein